MEMIDRDILDIRDYAGFHILQLYFINIDWRGGQNLSKFSVWQFNMNVKLCTA